MRDFITIYKFITIESGMVVTRDGERVGEGGMDNCCLTGTEF